jgi:hypothetical protein
MLCAFVGIVRGTSYSECANHWIGLNASTWGWIQLPGGVIGPAPCSGSFSGAAWARPPGIFIAANSVLANFRFTPFEPYWALMIIFIDLRVVHSADCPTLPSRKAGGPMCVLVVTLGQTEDYRNDHRRLAAYSTRSKGDTDHVSEARTPARAGLGHC